MDEHGNRMVEIIVPLVDKLETEMTQDNYQIHQVDLGVKTREGEQQGLQMSMSIILRRMQKDVNTKYELKAQVKQLTACIANLRPIDDKDPKSTLQATLKGEIRPFDPNRWIPIVQQWKENFLDLSETILKQLVKSYHAISDENSDVQQLILSIDEEFLIWEEYIPILHQINETKEEELIKATVIEEGEHMLTPIWVIATEFRVDILNGCKDKSNNDRSQAKKIMSDIWKAIEDLGCTFW